MIIINNSEEMKPFYNEKLNSYIFNDDVKFTFDLEIESDIVAGNRYMISLESCLTFFLCNRQYKGI